MLSVITKSCKLRNDRVKIRLPIGRRLLELIIFEIKRFYDSQPYLKKLYCAAFMLAYYGMMRIGEITSGNHAVKAKDIHMGRNKNKILLLLYSSKTHGKESRPQKIKIERTTNIKSPLMFCPFTIVREFLNARGNYDNDSEPCFVFRDKTKVKPTHVRKLLKKMLTKLNLNPHLYNTHSMRAGRCTDLVKHFGKSISEVMRAGRWRTTSSVMKYIKA